MPNVTDMRIYKSIHLPLDSIMIWQSSLLLLMYEVSLGGNLYNGLTLITNIQLVYCKVTRNVGGKYDNCGDQLAQCESDRKQDLQTYTVLYTSH